MKKLVIVLICLFAIVLLIGLAFCLLINFDFSRIKPAKFEQNVYTADGSFENIRIDEGFADVVFLPSEGEGLKVVCVEHEKMNHVVTVENGTLKIGVDDKRAFADRFTFLSLSSKRPSTTVYLPSDVYKSLIINCTTGSVTFGDLTVDDVGLTVTTGKTTLSNLKCKSFVSKTTTGSVSLHNTVSEGKLEISVVTGKVGFSDCDAAEIKISVTTGDVSGTLLTPKVFTAKATTGKVSVPSTTTGGSCSITTVTGDIDIKIVE